MMKDRLKQNLYFIVPVLFISITILVMDHLNTIALPKVVQDINSGVIGALLTIIITLVLLNNQSASEESQVKNSLIFEEKLRLFQAFLNTLNDSLIDSKLTSEELKKIIYEFSLIKIHLSGDSIEKIKNTLKKINNEFFFTNEFGVPRFDLYTEFYTKICNIIRKELYHDKENLADFYLENFETLSHYWNVKKIEISSFSEILEVYRKNQSVVFFENENIFQFQLNPEKILLFEKIYIFFKKVLGARAEQDERPVVVDNWYFNYKEEFKLKQFSFVDDKFNGPATVSFLLEGKLFAELGISRTSKIYIKIPKTPKPVIFTFYETTDLDEITSDKMDDELCFFYYDFLDDYICSKYENEIEKDKNELPDEFDNDKCK